MTEPKNVSILLVEDEALVAEDLQMRLERMGYSVVGTVDRGEDVLPRTIELGPDLVLLDIKLKGQTDGITAGRRLREMHPVPFVFVTAHADRATLDRACGAEPFGYVVKPFDERAIHASIEMALNRNRVEQQLRATERRMRMILRNIDDTVVVTDVDRRITFMNDSGESLTRWPIGMALGEPFDRVFRFVRGADGTVVPCPAAEAVRSGSVVRLEEGVELIRRDGNHVPVDDSASPLREGSDGVTGAVVVVRDCSERAALAKERRLVELAIRQSQHLEGMGRIASGLAHDFNNLLTAILGNAELLSTGLANDRANLEMVGAITASARAAAGICRRLIDSTVVDSTVREILDLDGLVDETIDLVRVLLGRGIQLRIERANIQPMPRGDRLQVQQVIMNLLVNAAEAVGDGPGEIAIRTGVVSETGRPTAGTAIPVLLKPGDYAFLEVRDTGPGMDPEVRARVFEPFFSTKPNGRGLGLSGVLGIIRGHRGGIRVDSAPGAGTAFRILLPLYETSDDVASPPPPPLANPTRAPGDRLLVVDDDPAVRSLIVRLARNLGIACVEAGDAVAAQALLLEPDHRIGAALVDVNMPGTSGPQLLARLRERWPEVRAALVSGTMPPADAEARGLKLLAKPFTTDEFAAMLRELLPHRAGR